MRKRQLAAGCSLVIVFFKTSILILFASLCLFVSGYQARAEMPSVASNLTSSRPASDDELHWHDNLQSGWKEAKATGRPMVIFITSEQCVYCDAMKRDTLCNESVRKRLFARFIPIRLRPGSNNRVLSRIKIPAYPTTLVAYPQGKVVTHRVGYQPAAEFLDMLNEVAPAEDSVAIR